MDENNSSLQQGAPQQLPTPSATSNKLNPLFLGIGAVILLGVGLLGGYLFRGNSNEHISENMYQQTQLSPTSYATSPTSTPTDQTATWKVYTIKEVSMQFKLPPVFKDVKEQVVAGQKGTQICLEPAEKSAFIIQKAYAGGGCNSNYSSNLRIGTTSVDYQQGRSGSFTDLQGFVLQNGKYLGKFVNGQTVELPQNSLTKITNGNGVEVLKVKGKFNPDDGPSLMNSLGDNTGIIVNTHSATYPGMTMAIKLTNDVTEDTINQIISSIKFTN